MKTNRQPVDDVIMVVPTPRALPDAGTYRVSQPKPRPQGQKGSTFDLNSFDVDFARVFGGAQ